MLMVVETMDEREAMKASVGMALVSHGAPPEAIFPGLFKAPAEEESHEQAARRSDGTYDIDQIDDSAIDWSTPIDPTQDEELSRWIAQHEQGVVTGADLERSEWH